MTVVGVDLSTLRVDLAWIDDTGHPQRWHQVIGDPKARAKKTEDVIDSLRRIAIQWPMSTSTDPGGAMVTEVCIEYPRGQNHAVTAKLAAVAGVITRQAPRWARVSWIDSRDLRSAIGAKNTKLDAHRALIRGCDPALAWLRHWNEHELDALVACVAWTRILDQQETAA